MATGNGKAAGFKKQVRADLADLRGHVGTLASAMRDLAAIAGGAADSVEKIDRKVTGLETRR